MGRGKPRRSDGYRPRSLAKRRRRSVGELDDLLQVVRGLLAQQSGAISIRHLFYLVESTGAIEKTERGYKNLRQQLTKWRRAGSIEWSAFTDSTRWYYGRPGHPSMAACLEESIRTYRYAIWQDVDAHVEIWGEKDAIASILLEAADPWHVQVFPVRGFASLTSLYNAAETFREKQAEGKIVYVYYFGDHDPSGVAIDPAAVAALRDDFGVKIIFERVAVTEAQIGRYRLPTRPTKATDSRAKDFVGESVEIDAMARDVLIGLVEDCITQHLPPGRARQAPRGRARGAGERCAVSRRLGAAAAGVNASAFSWLPALRWRCLRCDFVVTTREAGAVPEMRISGGDMIDLARDYILARGFRVIPVPYQSKRPIIDGWPKLRLEVDDLADSFNGQPSNIGGLLGEPSGNLGDVDLDVMEALALADAFLPPRRACSVGRVSPAVTGCIACIRSWRPRSFPMSRRSRRTSRPR